MPRDEDRHKQEETRLDPPSQDGPDLELLMLQTERAITNTQKFLDKLAASQERSREFIKQNLDRLKANLESINHKLAAKSDESENR